MFIDSLLCMLVIVKKKFKKKVLFLVKIVYVKFLQKKYEDVEYKKIDICKS